MPKSSPWTDRPPSEARVFLSGPGRKIKTSVRGTAGRTEQSDGQQSPAHFFLIFSEFIGHSYAKHAGDWISVA